MVYSINSKGNKFSHTGDSPKWVKSKRREKRREKEEREKKKKERKRKTESW